MGWAVAYFTLLTLMGTYTYTFKEDFTPTLINEMIAVAVVVGLLTFLFCIIF